MILLYIHVVSISEIKTGKSTHFCSEHVAIVIENETNALMDKFVVKTAAVPWKEKTRSHLPVNLTAKDRAVKYPEGTFHMDDGLLFCSSCNVVIDLYESVWWTKTSKRPVTSRTLKRTKEASSKQILTVCLQTD